MLYFVWFFVLEQHLIYYILILQQSNDADADGYADIMDQDMTEG